MSRKGANGRREPINGCVDCVSSTVAGMMTYAVVERATSESRSANASV